MTCPCSLGKPECNCAGRPSAEQIKFSTDFAELEGERSRRVDFWVNWLIFAAVIGIAGAEVFWPGR